MKQTTEPQKTAMFALHASVDSSEQALERPRDLPRGERAIPRPNRPRVRKRGVRLRGRRRLGILDGSPIGIDYPEVRRAADEEAHR